MILCIRLAVVALVLGLVADARAFPIEGASLVIKNAPNGTNTIIFKSKDGIIDSGNFGSDGDPRCEGAGGGGGALRINGGGANDVTIDLPCGGWITTNGSPENIFNTDYIYTDVSDSSCKRVTVKHGKALKVICRGPHVAYLLGAPQGDIDVTLRLGTLPVLNCATFGPDPTEIVRDGSNGRTYVALGAPAPDSCTSP